MTEILFRLANLVLSVSALTVALLIVAEIRRRPTSHREPLGSVVCVVFLAIGVQAAVRIVGTGTLPASMTGTIVTADWLAALATVGFLLQRRRYAVFIENAGIVREFETGYAQKEREARALAQVNEELRRLDELKSEFLAMISHELRTPLTAIMGYSRLLARQVHGPLSPRQLEHQEAVFRSAQRLSDLINDLLDVSRLEAGRVVLEPRPTDLRQVVDQVIAIVRVAASGKRIRVVNAVAEDLPAVQTDPMRLHQILVNLIGNGVKFTPAGGSVRVLAGVHKSQVWVTVDDTGVGIPHDELARIWEAFYQVGSPMRRRHGGSGLGLSIVRRLVELHGGIVRAESDGENRGSRFTFTVPIATEPATVEPVSDADTGVEPALDGRRVIVIEDEEHNQALMRAVVEDILGGTAIICDDGEKGLAEAINRPPALIVLDLMLPRLSGWEVARRLRQHAATRDVPIVAVSALARAQERETALHAGCDVYLAKPFTPDGLARVIVSMLAGEKVAR